MLKLLNLLKNQINATLYNILIYHILNTDFDTIQITEKIYYSKINI